LLIAAKAGEEELETSLGDGRVDDKHAAHCATSCWQGIKRACN
jgi:hypothetical protein